MSTKPIDDLLAAKARDRAALERKIAIVDAEIAGLESAKRAIEAAASAAAEIDRQMANVIGIDDEATPRRRYR